jgi:hypothetical protein
MADPVQWPASRAVTRTGWRTLSRVSRICGVSYSSSTCAFRFVVKASLLSESAHEALQPRQLAKGPLGLVAEAGEDEAALVGVVPLDEVAARERVAVDLQRVSERVTLSSSIGTLTPCRLLRPVRRPVELRATAQQSEQKTRR